MLLCSPVRFSFKPVIAKETCNSQQKEKSSVLIAGYLDLPVQTLTGGEALLECNDGNNTGTRAKGSSPGAGNRGICLLVIGAERGPALLLDWK